MRGNWLWNSPGPVEVVKLPQCEIDALPVVNELKALGVHRQFRTDYAVVRGCKNHSLWVHGTVLTGDGLGGGRVKIHWRYLQVLNP